MCKRALHYQKDRKQTGRTSPVCFFYGILVLLYSESFLFLSSFSALHMCAPFAQPRLFSTWENPFRNIQLHTLKKHRNVLK